MSQQQTMPSFPIWRTGHVCCRCICVDILAELYGFVVCMSILYPRHNRLWAITQWLHDNSGEADLDAFTKICIFFFRLGLGFAWPAIMIISTQSLSSMSRFSLYFFQVWMGPVCIHLRVTWGRLAIWHIPSNPDVVWPKNFRIPSFPPQNDTHLTPFFVHFKRIASQ